MNDKILHLRFCYLDRQWRSDTIISSNPNDSINHPAYQEIMKMGPVATPWVMQRMRNERVILYSTFLREIAGCDVEIPEEEYGRLAPILRRYIRWGEERGYFRMKS